MEGSQLSLLDLLEQPSLEGLLSPDDIYHADDFTLFTRVNEDTRFDRKSARVDTKGLAICLSAFGNGPSVSGGVVAVGVENDRTISGCLMLSEQSLHEIEDAGSSACHSGRFQVRRLGCINRAGETDFLILIRMFYVDDRLVELNNGDAYRRTSRGNKKLSDHEKQEIRISKGERAFELEPCSLDYPKEFNLRRIEAFADMVREFRDGSRDVSTEQILEIMHLGKRRDGLFQANSACCLLFAKDPQQVFPGAYVRFLRYSGTEEGSGKDYNVIKDRLISGCILDVIQQAAAVIDANLREFTTYQDGKFYSVPEYPRDAWYELLINACVHRSYHIKNAPVFVKMFDDRLVFESPGGFMPYVTPDNIYEMHRPRNPFLMLVLREMGEVRCINEGTKRVRKEMIDANLPAPEFFQEASSGTVVRAVIKNDITNRSNALDSEAYRVLGEEVALSLDSEEKKIINYVIEHGAINVSEALRIMSTTYWHTAKKRLVRLSRRGILIHESTMLRDPKARFVLKNGNGAGNGRR